MRYSARRDIGSEKLASLLAGQSGISAVLSLPAAPNRRACRRGPRVLEALAALRGLEPISKRAHDVLVDATHPFAEQISRNAAIAAAMRKFRLSVCRARLVR